MALSLETIKTIYSVLQEAKRLDLAEQLIGLRTDMIEAMEENLKLREENSALNKRLELKSKVVFEQGICWIKDDEMTDRKEKTPICPQCWQVDGIVNRLPVQRTVTDKPVIHCQRCRTGFEII